MSSFFTSLPEEPAADKGLFDLDPFFYEEDASSIFMEERLLIDVRAPVEFMQGSLPNSINLPILDDVQRHEVGLCYRREGQATAIALGSRLVSGRDREQKIAAWLAAADRHPGTLLCCLRGGLRSRIAQQWLKEAGKNVPIVEGGYKRLRNLLLARMAADADRLDFLVLSGRTGAGKTILINRLAGEGFRAVDLEGIANHRGSAFGQNPAPQPPQATFENGVALQLIREDKKAPSRILLEDESLMIGDRRIPEPLYRKKLVSPVFVLEVPLDTRAGNILRDYVEARWPLFREGEDPFGRFLDYFRAPLDRIRKRLGGVAHAECLRELTTAVEHQEKTGSFELHKAWISRLLAHYYDPLYDKSLDKKREFIVGSGDETALRALLAA